MSDLSAGLGNTLRKNRYYLIALLVIFVDQLVKLSVKFSMTMGDEMRVFGDWFKITYVENRGAAFGLTIGDILGKVGIEITEETSKLILTLFSIFAVIVIIYLLRQVLTHKSPLPLFLSLILGGALGNIVDRVFYGAWFAGMNNYDGALLHGRVVDMFHLDMGTLRLFGKTLEMWPVFNIADAAISVGIVAILLFQRRFLRLNERRTQSPVPGPDTDSETPAPNPEKPSSGELQDLEKGIREPENQDVSEMNESSPENGDKTMENEHSGDKDS